MNLDNRDRIIHQSCPPTDAAIHAGGGWLRGAGGSTVSKTVSQSVAPLTVAASTSGSNPQLLTTSSVCRSQYGLQVSLRPRPRTSSGPGPPSRTLPLRVSTCGVHLSVPVAPLTCFHLSVNPACQSNIQRNYFLYVAPPQPLGPHQVGALMSSQLEEKIIFSQNLSNSLQMLADGPELNPSVQRSGRSFFGI